MKRRGIGRVIMALVAVVMLGGCDWTSYLAGPAHSSSSADGGVHLGDVAGLTARWRWQPTNAPGRPATLLSTPVTWKGRIFVGGGDGVFYALDASTRSVLWQRDFGYQPALTCASAQGFISSPAVVDDGSGNPLVYVHAPDGYLYELNGDTGTTKWRAVVRVPSTTKNDAFAWSSPTVANGKVYVGIASNCDRPLIRGAVKSYDAATGRLLAGVFLMPTGYVGAGVWTSAAADGGGVYVTTGSVYDSTQAAHPPTVNNAFDQYSLLKLDPNTLAVAGKFVAAPSTIPDVDFGSSPILFEGTIGGATVQLVGACDKDGSFYAVRTDTMQLAWSRVVGTGNEDGAIGCLSGGIWDGSHLFVAGNATTIGGVAAPGSVRQLDPSTGAIVWETPLPANPLGSGSINANGILAFAGTDWSGGPGNGVYLVDAASGTLLRTLHDIADYPEFAQPIWVDGQVLATNTNAVVAWSP